MPAEGGYEVVDPPALADQADAAPQLLAGDGFVSPRNGQTAAQTAADRYQCHRWAKDPTGLDPTQVNGAVPGTTALTQRAAYHRALTACLEARGYSVEQLAT